MIDLSGKQVLITGGSRGIGAETVKLFSKANADVIFTYRRDIDSAKQLISDCISKVVAVQCDFSDEDSIKSFLNKVTEFAQIDVLVNNVGIWKKNPIDKMNLLEWNETISINLNSVFLLTSEIAKKMKKNKFGRIINVSSTAAQRGEAFYSHYAASKGAINSFTKSLAVELGGYNITVNAVAPGWVETEMSAETINSSELHKEIIKAIPTGRVAHPKDIAGPILFLASDLACHINGEILNINGGSVLCG